MNKGNELSVAEIVERAAKLVLGKSLVFERYPTPAGELPLGARISVRKPPRYPGRVGQGKEFGEQ